MLKRLLITGAAGALGSHCRQNLGHLAETVRVSDIADLGAAAPHEEVVQADLSDRSAVMSLVEGCDGIVHFGGKATEGEWSVVRDANIEGMYNLYEAARQSGCRRIFYASSIHAVGGNAGGFDQRSLQVTYRIWQLGYLVLLQAGEIRQAARFSTKASARERRTQMPIAAAAVVATPTDDGRHDGHTVPRFYVANIGSDFHDFPGKLMAECLRKGCPGESVRLYGSDDGSHQVLVQISSTNSTERNLYQYIVGFLGLRNRDVFQTNIFRGVKACCKHGFFPFPIA